MEKAYVFYHSSAWAAMVEAGWVTWSVDSNYVATMVRGK